VTVDAQAHELVVTTLAGGRRGKQPDSITRRMVEINVLGVMFGTKEALRRMLPRRSGHIINIASLAGEGAFPGAASYCGTKFAVVGFTEAARLENLGTGVDISAVLPTFTTQSSSPARRA